jgi:hypothetical protein
MTETKAERVERLKKVIDDTHVMQDTSLPSQWDGCGVNGCEVCLICGLEHEYWRGGQRQPDQDEYRVNDTQITLWEASQRSCGDQKPEERISE